MTDTLRQRTVHALSWSFLEVLAQKSVQFVVGVVLARLLFPEQFGLIGMLTIFIVVLRTFLDSGFGAALIQKRAVTETDICSIFYFNILVGAAAAGILCMVAPWVAAFYNQPVLTGLTRALSLTIVIDSFGMIQGTLLTREIDFKTQTKVSFIAGALSGAIGITLAALGFGVWSLVIQQVASSLFYTGSLWLFSSWRPGLIFSFSALRDMFGFGSRILASGVLNRIFDNLYLLVIGKMFTAASLGFFTRAKTLCDLPSMTLSDMVGRVTFPVFSSIQDDPARVKRGLKKALRTLVLVNFPIMLGMAVVARPLVLVLLTDRWLESVPYLQLLCVAGTLYPIHLMNLNVLQAMGRSDLFLRLEIIKKALIAANVAISWRWGISAMIYGMIITSIISYYLNSYYNGRMINYRIGEQVLDLLPYLGVSLVMAAAVSAIGFLPFQSTWLELAVKVSGGILSYIVLCRFFRLKAFMDMWHEMSERVPLLNAGAARGVER